MRLVGLAISFGAAIATAQPNPPSISIHGLATYGPSVIDPAGNVYATGTTGRVTKGAAQTQPGGGTCDVHLVVLQPCSDAIIVKMDSAGNVVFGSWLGGPTADAGTAIAVDGAGNVYVAGATNGYFPTTANAAIPVSATSRVFAAKLSADGASIVYATYLPDFVSSANALALDAQGNAYIAGQTASQHAYVVKLSADGSAFSYMRLLAGRNQESSTAILSNTAGEIIVAGHTSSPDFPVTAGAFQPVLAGEQNVFITKVDEAGFIAFSTYLGGSAVDYANAVQTDSARNIYIAGYTGSLDFPTTAGSFQPEAHVPLWSEVPGGFITKLSPDGATLAYSTYVTTSAGASPSLDGVAALAVTPSGETYFAGHAGASFPTTDSAPQPCFGGGKDVLLGKLDASGALRDATYFGGPYEETVSNITLGGDGSIMMIWHQGGPQAFARIRFGDPGWRAPACISSAVLNSATLDSNGPIAPGEFVTFTGIALGPAEGIGYQPDPEGRAPVALGGVRVWFDGQPAPVLYAQSRQVNAMVPFDLTPSTSITVTLEYNNAAFGPITVPVTPGQGGVFRLEPNVSAQALATNEDGTRNTPSNPARPGSVVSIWGTGFGPTTPACQTGGLNLPEPANLAPGYAVQIAELNLKVEYAGSAPTQLCGVVQINMRVPPDTAPGDLWVSPLSAWTFNQTASAQGAGSSKISVK
jgi:uncharacterized protein (TIGR03437 family)